MGHKLASTEDKFYRPSEVKATEAVLIPQNPHSQCTPVPASTVTTQDIGTLVPSGRGARHLPLSQLQARALSPPLLVARPSRYAAWTR